MNKKAPEKGKVKYTVILIINDTYRRDECLLHETVVLPEGSAIVDITEAALDEYNESFDTDRDFQL